MDLIIFRIGTNRLSRSASVNIGRSRVVAARCGENDRIGDRCDSAAIGKHDGFRADVHTAVEFNRVGVEQADAAARSPSITSINIWGVLKFHA
jgi:hypothetical protein